mgnify:CR=1 FL=1
MKDTPRYGYAEICTLDNDALEKLFLQGSMPENDHLIGYEFDGFNTLDITPLLGIRRFQKGFFLDPKVAAGEIGGYNVAIAPGGVTEHWEQLTKGGVVHRHSFYRVYPVRDDEVDNLYPNAVLINYDSPRNPVWNPGPLRDYLVRVYPDDNDLYLGKAYAAVGPKWRVFVSYFVLRRGPKVEDYSFAD